MSETDLGPGAFVITEVLTYHDYFAGAYALDQLAQREEEAAERYRAEVKEAGRRLVGEDREEVLMFESVARRWRAQARRLRKVGEQVRAQEEEAIGLRSAVDD